MRVNGKLIKDMVEAMNDILMEISIKENSNSVKLMVKVAIIGSRVRRYTMESGLRG